MSIRIQIAELERELETVEKERDRFHAEVVKLRSALETIAAKHLDPFCPELFDDPVEVIRNDTEIARTALKEARDMAPGPAR